MAIVGYIDLYDAETRRQPLPHHVAGLQYTRSGYGRRIPSEWQVKRGNRWRRIYICQFSNAGTAYILQGQDWLVCTGTPKEGN